MLSVGIIHFFYIAGKPNDCNQDQSLRTRQGSWKLLGRRAATPARRARGAQQAGSSEDTVGGKGRAAPSCSTWQCSQETASTIPAFNRLVSLRRKKSSPRGAPRYWTWLLAPGTRHPTPTPALRASTDHSWDWPGCGQDAAGMCLGCIWGQLGCRAAVSHPCLGSTHRFPWKSTTGRRSVQ